jgi:N-acetylneuraminic acid mutarotase
MKIFLSICIACWFFDLKAQDWNQIADFTGDSRDDATVFKINNQVFCGLGMNAGFNCTSDFKIFDLNTETWSNGISLPAGEERQYANGFSHLDFGYVFGGINSNATYLNDFWKFNSLTNEWISLPDLPAQGRAGVVIFLIDNTVYVLGGKTSGGIISNEVWAFDLIQEQWFQKVNLPIDGIWRGVGFSWNNAGIIGHGKLNDGSMNTGFYYYSPVSDTWQIISQVNLAPTTYSMFSQIGKFGFIYGGVFENQSYSNQFLKVDLETWETSNLTDFPAEARRGGVSFVGNDEFYISTGVSAVARLNETWKASYILGVEDEKAIKNVKIYPNPLKNWMVIDSDVTIQSIEIFDVSGKLIESKKVNSHKIEFPIALENGVYLVKLVASNSALIERICVQN